jgi:hypothetical protein
LKKCTSTPRRWTFEGQSTAWPLGSNWISSLLKLKLKLIELLLLKGLHGTRAQNGESIRLAINDFATAYLSTACLQ